MYYRFPEYQKILHDLLFPAVIYGLVFVLMDYLGDVLFKY